MSNNVTLPKGVWFSEIKLTLCQDKDTCDNSDEPCQVMNVKLESSGMGFYYTINSKRFAIDADEDGLKLLKTLNYLCDVFTKLES
jgi:hypothetical protein